MLNIQHLIPRDSLLDRVRLSVREFPVTVLLGARQVGKTTLARQFAESWDGDTRFLDLEIPSVHESVSINPSANLRGHDELIAVDEVQRNPALFQTLRPLCDDPKNRAVYLLLGSASRGVIEGVSESLAGRANFIDVPGFSLSEVGDSEQSRLWLRGGFPRAYLSSNGNSWRRWVDAFVRTFIERDVANAVTKYTPVETWRFINMLAHLHGQIWNAASLSASLDMTHRRVNQFRDALESAFVIRVLPPWFENLGKRLVKSPKVYIRDSGILHFLHNIQNPQDLPLSPIYGPSWEGFAIEQVLTRLGSRDAYFYRTQRGAELDLLMLRSNQRWGFEFKCGDNPRSTRSMHVAVHDLDLDHLWVVYPGTYEYELAENISVVPLSTLHQSIGAE